MTKPDSYLFIYILTPNKFKQTSPPPPSPPPPDKLNGGGKKPTKKRGKRAKFSRNLHTKKDRKNSQKCHEEELLMAIRALEEKEQVSSRWLLSF